MIQESFEFNASIQDRFEAFHASHPEVLEVLVQFSRAVKAAGFNRYGIRSIWERMRWHFQVDRGCADFKLNDHYHSRYARLIMRECPDLEGFFETRGNSKT